MPATETLLAFFLASLVLAVAPGPDNLICADPGCPARQVSRPVGDYGALHRACWCTPPPWRWA